MLRRCWSLGLGLIEVIQVHPRLWKGSWGLCPCQDHGEGGVGEPVGLLGRQRSAVGSGEARARHRWA